MRAVRIWFSKKGNAKYISHLDTMRYMTRMLRKTGLELYYTQGFNPRLYMIFALSLPLGVEGSNECLDVRFLGDETDEEILACLNMVSTPEITFTGISEPKYRPVDIRYAEYSVIIPQCDEEVKNIIVSKLMAGNLFAVKKNKKNLESVINLSEHTRNLSVDELGESIILNFILPAGSVNNISPLLFLSALFKDTNYDFRMTKIERKRLLIDKMKNYG